MARDDVGAAAERRWQQALSLLEGANDVSARRRLQHRRLTIVAVTVGVLVIIFAAAGVVGFAVAGQHPAGPDHRSHVAVWRAVLALVVILGGLVVLILPLFRLRRSGGYRSAWSAPSLILTYAQRRQLVKQIRGKAPVDLRWQPLASDVAGRLVRQSSQTRLVLAGLALTQLGQMIGAAEPWRIVLAVGLLVLFALAAALTLRRATGARRFLEQHPEGTHPASVTGTC